MIAKQYLLHFCYVQYEIIFHFSCLFVPLTFISIYRNWYTLYYDFYRYNTILLLQKIYAIFSAGNDNLWWMDLDWCRCTYYYKCNDIIKTRRRKTIWLSADPGCNLSLRLLYRVYVFYNRDWTIYYMNNMFYGFFIDIIKIEKRCSQTCIWPSMKTENVAFMNNWPCIHRLKLYALFINGEKWDCFL